MRALLAGLSICIVAASAYAGPLTEARVNKIINEVSVVDPQTGQAYKVESGSSYYWIDPVREVIIGTNTPYRLPSNFHEVMQSYD